MQEGLDEIESALTTYMISINNGLDRLGVTRPMAKQDGSLMSVVDEASKLDLAAGEASVQDVPMEVGDDSMGFKNKNKNRTKK